MPPFVVRRGATERLTLYSTLGSTFTATGCVATMKLCLNRNPEVTTDAHTADFTVTSFPGDATRGKGYYLDITSATVTGLPDGLYKASAEITYISPSAGIEHTDSWFIDLQTTPSV